MNWQDMVREFNVKFGATVGKTPAIRDPDLRISLIEEEAKETVDAIRSGDLVAAVDGLCDLIYVALGAGVAFGVDLEPLFAEVHRSNMAKQGGPTRADGKILKPKGWQAPRIAELLADQPSRITIQLDGLMREVSARIVGEAFAVHRSVRTEDGAWTLSHVPTGYALVHTNEREDAIRIGEELASMGLAAFASNHPKVVADGVPKSVSEWLHRCADARGFVPFANAA